MAITSSKPHYFQVFPSDWSALKIRAMNMELRGIYMTLLCAIYDAECNLPDNDDIWQAMSITEEKWLEAKTRFLAEPPLIYIENGKIYNERLNTSYKQVAIATAQRIAAGKASAEARKDKPIKTGEFGMFD